MCHFLSVSSALCEKLGSKMFVIKDNFPPFVFSFTLQTHVGKKNSYTYSLERILQVKEELPFYL